VINMDDKAYISRFRYIPPNEQGISASGYRNTTIYRQPNQSLAEDMRNTSPCVFTTESGAIGMEAHGRIDIKTIEAWIAMAWGDIK